MENYNIRNAFKALKDVVDEPIIEEKKPLMESSYAKLDPKFDHRKSFYGKARVLEKDDGTKVLYSYGTPVVRIRNGEATLLTKGYLGWSSSPTTLRHVKDFLQQNGFKAGSYKDLAKMYKVEQAEFGEGLKEEKKESKHRYIVKSMVNSSKNSSPLDTVTVFAKSIEDACKKAYGKLQNKDKDYTDVVVSCKETDEEESFSAEDFDDKFSNGLTESKVVNVNDKSEVEDGKKFLEDGKGESDVEQIVDVNADDVTELKKSYVGDIALECSICHSKQYIRPEELVKSDKVDNNDNKLYNVDTECAHCGSTGEGFILLGQIAKYDPDEAQEDQEGGDEPTEEPEAPKEEEPKPSLMGEPSEENEGGVKESLNEEAGKARYFIQDLVDEHIMPSIHEFKSEDEFLDSLEYNYEIAKEYGDDVEESFDEVNDKFDSNKDFSADYNGFEYVKLTEKTPEEFFGEEEAKLIETISREDCEDCEETEAKGLEESRFDGKKQSEFKFVIKYSDSSEEDYEDVDGWKNAKKFFDELKNRKDVDYVEVYQSEEDWEKRDPDSIVLSFEKGLEESRFDGIDEGKFDSIMNGCIKECYGSKASYKTASGKIDRNGNVILEGKAKIGSAEKPVKFMLECKGSKGKVSVSATNEGLLRMRKPIKISCSISKGDLICESIEK